ncbi:MULTISPECIES: winged helix-turn-helix transcriptional regulator [unclassified Chitinophaga]|uniref:winged helix-turn-helix transcriptional regulator n=1 Tax=unclassified Chitinophaga TaxID=2619133 RepID=UPI00300FEBD6
MTYQRKIPILDCGHEYIREILYGRWKIPLIYYIANGVSRPGELQRKIPHASRRVLDAQLTQLVKHEIISKTVFDETVRKVEYQLTEFGLTLMPVMMAMIKWGNNNIEQLKRVTR